MNEFIKEQLMKRNTTFIAEIEIPRNVNDDIYKKGKSRQIKKWLLNLIEESITVLPLYGGGMSSDGTFTIVLGFKNDKIHAYWSGHVFNHKLRLVFPKSNLEKWLWQKKIFFGWQFLDRICG